MRTVIIILLLGWAAVAAAEPRRDADEHARRGVALYNLGKYEAAIDEFEQAYTLFQSDALLFNLAQAHRQLQHCERALYYYRRFLDGSPAPALATQVESLLPKLEAACRTKLEPPAGPDGTPPSDATARPPSAAIGPAAAASPPALAGMHPPAPDAGEPRDAAEAPARTVAERPQVRVTGSLSAGMVLAGRSAPTTGIRLTATAPVSWLHGLELGGAFGLARLWRGDDLHDATLGQVTATICHRSAFGWGRITLAGELGAAYFSSLDDSDGVVPGISAAPQWVPLVRGEVGIEHDIAPGFAVRVAGALALSPRMGMLLTSVGELDALVGVRYER
ncbi:MAG TPA: tetratricopeptide repeat protein [Kofleriaceae bacterium]|jgi:hypothetical protein|nr:tetratricopeptide repeat protein [Kofleriaceae bacterium]